MDIQNNTSNKTIFWGSGLFFLITTTFLIYQQGATGVFLFDDFNNISPIGRYTSLSSWDNFWLFTLEGIAGPTGRPVSLASFFLNTQEWPAPPVSFIQTNIIIHLLNGSLIYWLVFKLSGYVRSHTYKKQLVFSLLVTALWLLHPMHLTTVLYIIQRMTELSATFMLSGLLFYIYGREQLQKTSHGFFTLFIGVGVSLILSILSKENGILLVAYILVIEFFLLRPLKVNTPKNFNYWLIPAVVLPFIIIILYLAWHTNPASFINRDFTLIERLLTEPRILFDYIRQILLPNMNELTLYHDDYKISKSLLAPWTTLIALIGVFGLILTAFLLRKKRPFIAFSIAWFFTGHLLESTVLPLELYYEHRNYLPMLGFFISIAYYAVYFFDKYKTFVITAIGFMLVFNSFVLVQNTKLWGKPLELFISWYKAHPNSPRTQQQFSYAVKGFNLSPELIQQIAPESKKSQVSPMLIASYSMSKLALKCNSNSATTQTLKNTLKIVKNNIIHISTATNLTSFIDSWLQGKCQTLGIDEVKSFLSSLLAIIEDQKVNVFAHDVHYSLSRIYVRKKNLDRTIFHLKKAYNYVPTLNNLLAQAFYLSSAGLYDKALSVLEDTSALANKGFRAKIALTIRMKEVDKLKSVIRLSKNNKSINKN